MFMLGLIGAAVAVVFFSMVFAARQYKRCSSDQILVVFGKTSGGKTAECIHGGGRLIIPLIQDYKYLSLKPLSISVPLRGALSKNNIRVNIPSNFMVAVSTKADVMQNAAERLLGLDTVSITKQVQEIIIGQLRAVVANLTIEELNSDRDKLLNEVNTQVTSELKKLGLDLINVNIEDITDESGYLESLGKKAVATALNQAKVDTALQTKLGAVGSSEQEKEQETQVAANKAAQEIGKKEADRTRRVKTAEFDAEAIQGENESKAKVASYNASLAQKEAESFKVGEVAKANASRDVALAEKEAKVAELQREELAQQEVNKQKVTVQAEAEAAKVRLTAEGEAAAIKAKYAAEAEGIKAVLEAKAEGYKKLIEAAGKPELAPTLLMIEKMSDITKAQAEMVKNIKIDKITVWDSGKGETSNFLQSFTKFLPPMQDVAKQAGFSMPSYLGSLSEQFDKEDTTPSSSSNGSNGNGSNGHARPVTKSNGSAR